MWRFGIKITVDLRVNGMENTARQHRGVLGACKTKKIGVSFVARPCRSDKLHS